MASSKFALALSDSDDSGLVANAPFVVNSMYSAWVEPSMSPYLLEAVIKVRLDPLSGDFPI